MGEKGAKSYWLELSLTIRQEESETAAEVLRRFCYGGVAIEEPFVPLEEGYSILPGRSSIAKGYLPVDRTLGLRKVHLRRALDRAGISDPWLEKRIPEEDWAQAWKAHFTALRVGKGLVIVPSWEEWQAYSGDIVIRLDPGMAFGTGTHPTTRMCLVELERTVKPGMKVIDLGTGSGILAIAAAKLGAERVLALDIDPLATRIARENVSANGVEDKVTVEAGSLGLGIEKAFGLADILVANLHSHLIMELAEGILSALKPGGLFIGSGISGLYLEDVKRALCAAGAGSLQARKDGEWRTILARSTSPA